MGREEHLKELIKEVQKDLPRKIKKILSSTAQQYFGGVDIDKALSGKRGEGSKRSVRIIYGLLNQIKMSGLEKIAPYFGGHEHDMRDPHLFADAVIRYCIGYGDLGEEIFNLFDGLSDEKARDLLYRKYRNGNSCNVIEELQVFAREPGLYLLIMRKLSKN